MFLEKSLGPGAVGNVERSRLPAGSAQRRAQGSGIGGRRSFRGYRLAACTKRLIGLQMIVLAPACDVGPRDRDILAAADLERPCETGIWNEARARKIGACDTGSVGVTRGISSSERNKRQRDGDHRERGGISPDATRVSERFPCQPASSSDRVTYCRG